VSVGMLAATTARLYISAFYALSNPRTPFRFALVRVTLTLVLGYLCAVPLPHLVGLDQRWGVVGLTASAGVAAWVEFAMLRLSLNRVLGWTGIERPYLIRLWTMALVASAVGIALKISLPRGEPRLAALAVIIGYGAAYLGLAYLTNEPELKRFVDYASRRLRRRG